MKLRINSLVLFACLAAALLGGAGLWAQSWLGEQTRAHTGRVLSTVLETSRQAVRSWAKEHRLEANFWANTPEVVALVEELLATPRTAEALLKVPAQRMLQDLLRPIHQGRDYRGCFVIGPGNINLNSSRDENIGVESLLVGEGNFLARVRSGRTALSPVLRSDVPLPDETGRLLEGFPTMFVGAPVKNLEGRIIAVFTFRIDPHDDFTALLQRGRVGESGETYAFDERGKLISEGRFDEELKAIGLIPGEHSILNLWIRDPGVDLTAGEKSPLPAEEQPLTLSAQGAVKGEAGMNLEGYRDYRGVSVVGAWAWDEDLNLGLATEIDADEAFRVLRVGRFVLTLVTLLAMGLLIGLTLVFTRSRRRIAESEERLLEANRELEAFTYTVSHDLRTPLTSMIGFAEYLKENFGVKLGEAGRDCLNEIESQGERMNRLMEDLLVLSRAGALERPETPVDAKEVCGKVLDDLKLRIAEVGAVVECRDLPAIRLPESLLIQVFENLVGNALNYAGEKGSQVEIDGQRKGERVRYFVRDHGPGIPQQERERIFEVFYRGETGKCHHGTGIGLATVQKIARSSGGDAWVEDTPGGGATFIVEFEDPPANA